MKINKAMHALLVVDVQNDFITGSLAVPGALEIIPIINGIIPKFGTVIYSVDSHIKDHPSFQAQGGPWPAHCVIGSFGHRLYKDLIIHTSRPILIHKGLKEEALSAFNGTVIIKGGPNVKAVEDLLYFHRIEELFICGLATDYCVKATTLDALRLFDGKIYVITDAIRAVNISEDDGDKAIKEMEEAGAALITSNSLEN